jgi:hypothetical protein
MNGADRTGNCFPRQLMDISSLPLDRITDIARPAYGDGLLEGQAPSALTPVYRPGV